VSVDYTYAVARLRAIEASLPDRAWFQRLVRAPADALLGAVREGCGAFDAVEALHRFEDGIEAEKEATLRLVCGLVGDEGVSTFLRASHDFDNLAHAWKAALLDRPASLTGYGVVDPMTLEEAVRKGRLSDLPDFLRETAEALDAEGDAIGPADVAYRVERHKWRWLLGAAPDATARRHVSGRIDLLNVRSIVRAHRDPFRRERIVEGLLEGGLVERSRWVALAGEPESELYSFLGLSDYRLLVRLGLGVDCPLWKLDPIVVATTIELGRGSAYRFFDIGPVLHHLDLRDRNCRLLRMVLAGKVNEVPDEIVQENVDALWPS